ncbi:MAG: hypothetical protein NZ840_09455 [Anaerolineales bacterium]|nr:hypothetical protein [Anaerolineales bacterium]MDW8162267.1 hypothetical protein [Anaerolineales bacterium]
MSKLITLFSAPKPFTNPHINLIQRNAIQSWLHLGEEVEVFLVGEEEGLDHVAQEYGVPQLTPVRCNELGTPLVSSIFELARRASQAPLMAYVNADILLLPDFVQAAKTLWAQRERFLAVSQRWDVEVTVELDFSEGWEQRLKAKIMRHGRLHPPAGSDLFLFPRTEFTAIPDFAVGRAGWDNWMIYASWQQGIPVVDLTPSVTIIHQDHDYSHLPGGQPHYNLEESQRNLELAGGMRAMYYILDSHVQLKDGRLRRPPQSLLRLLRKLELRLMPSEEQRHGWRWWLARRFRRARRFRMKEN